MPEVVVVLFDNALSSQNQDYLPGRFILQKEIIDTVITNSFETDRESLVGLVPIAQKHKNDILTPTKHRPYLTKFLYKAELCGTSNYFLDLFQADQSLHVSELSTKKLFAFFSSPVQSVEELLSSLYMIASKGIIIKVICFGECVALGEMLAKEIDLENFECLILRDDNDFNNRVLQFFEARASSGHDPELEEAIRRSLQQQ